MEVSEQNIELILNHVDHNDENLIEKLEQVISLFFNWIDDRIGNPCFHMKARPTKARPSDISKLAESGIPEEKAITTLSYLILITAVVVGAMLMIAVSQLLGNR
jgi:hypothetical protein